MLTMRELNTNYISNSPTMANTGALNEDPLVSSLSLPLNQLTKRCVIIQKDERGYGLRVSGESPVFVESVREGGAAWRAGVRPGDKIIKVSGTLVTHHHHGEVVRMIQSCGSYVGLTLLGLKTPPPSANMVPKPIQITGPQPASESTQQAYDENKVLKIKEMISKQKEHLNNLLANPKKNQKSEVEKTVKTIESLEKEIEKMTFDVTRHRHTSMSAENLTTGATSDPTIAGANANAKKSHSFGQYDTRAPIMTMESDEENDDFTNNNTNNSRRNSSLITNSKGNYPEISDIPKTVDGLHGHCLQMTRWLLMQDLPPHALLFYTIAGHVFPTLAAQTPLASRQSVQRLAWQIASTWLMKDSPLTFADFPSHSFDKFAETLESNQSSLETLFEPFFETTKSIISKQLDKWRSSVNIGLAPPVMQTARDELQATIQLVLNESTASLEQTVDTLLVHAHVNNASTLALVTALLTIGHFVFACPSKHLLFSQNDSTSCPPINPVLKLSMDSNKKHKRAVSCPNRNQSPGHSEAGHHFSPTSDITKPIYCSGCMCPVWGTFGLTCAHCQMSVHNWCMKNAAANSPCPGPQSDNQSSNTTPSVRAVKKSRRWNSDRYTIIDMIKKTVAPNHDSHAPPLISSSTSSSDDDDDDALITGVTSQPSLGAENATAVNSTTPTPPNTITRSESFRQRRKTVPSYRKRSDPALTTSNSTLAGTTVSTDSNLTPDISGSPTTTSPDNWQLSSSDDEDADQSQSDAQLQHSSASANTPTVSQQPALDEDTPPPLPPRPPSEKRKQIQNEILESEKRHVVVLKFINHVFYKPLAKERLLPESDLEMVFCNVKKLRDVHKEILRAMRTPNKSLEHSLCDIFCGTLGQRLEAEASYFCAKQKMGGLDTWRARKKDSKLKNFLDPELRTKGIPDDPLARLGLEDHLGTVFQRPLRYQLLLDRLLHATPSDSIEYTLVARALTRCREIGSVVNEATRKAESKQRLEELTRKTVKMDGLSMNVAEDNLIHEGPLTWRITKQKCVDVLLLLTDKILLILARDSNDKFVLKYHTNPAVKTIKPSDRSDTNQINNKTHHSPIVLLHDLFTRDVATDPTAFFLISKDHDVFYEFTAATPNEKKQWKDYISATTASFNLSKPNQTQAVTKLKDLTSQPSADEENKSKDIEETDIDKEEDKPEAEESNTSALTEEQNNNNPNDSNKATEEHSPKAETTPPQPNQSRFEGCIRYVSEEECRPPELISPTRVTISTEPNFEALAVQSPEQRIAEIDFKIKQLMEEKRTALANIRGIKDQNEWNVVSDMGEHDDLSSSAREISFFDKAMSLVSTLATDGLSTESYAPLVSLREQIDALLARITLDVERQRAEQTLYFGPNTEQSSDETAVYF